MNNIRTIVSPPDNSPWGHVDWKKKYSDGIWSLSTPGHGGIWLDRKHAAQLKKLCPNVVNFLRSWTYWEEDCDWAIPFYYFRDEILSAGYDLTNWKMMVLAAEDSIAHYHKELTLN